MPCFELLGIQICIPSVDDIVNGVLAPIGTLIMDGLSGLVNTLTPLFDNVVNLLSPLFQGVIDGVTGFVSGLISGVQTLAAEIWETVQALPMQVWGVIESLGSFITSGIATLGDEISRAFFGAVEFIGAGIQSVGTQITSTVGGAVDVIGSGLVSLGTQITEVVYDAGEGLQILFTAALNEVGGVLGSVFSGFGSLDVNVVLNAAANIGGLLTGAIGSLGLTFSPLTPDEAVQWVGPFINQVTAACTTLHTSNVLAEGASLGQIDITLGDAWRYPSTAGAVALATELSSMAIREGLMPVYKRHILRSYQPYLPPYQDLISIYVKEGYLEDHWLEIPEEMIQNFRELGFSEYWTLRLWGKHWVYPSPTQLYEMLHRTAGTFPEIAVTTEVLRDMLKLHDFEPKWRGPLEAISWNTWRIYDIRTGWEMDILTEEGLVNRLVDTGYEPKDAELLATIQKMFVLRSEIDKLLSEADQDFIEGWIPLETLRANYEATPYRSDVQELRVIRAISRRDREIKRDIKAALTDRFKKGDLTEAEFAEALSTLGVTEDWISTEVERANAYKLTKVKEETTTTAKALTEAKYSKAFKVGLITEEQYREALASIKYAPEDVDLLVELNTPEKPTPEEVKTLTAGELKAAFRVGVLSETELRDELAARKYAPEDIETLVETEKAKLKPAAAE